MKTAIKSFETACNYLGIDPHHVLPDVSGIPDKYQAATIAHTKLMIIAEALNKEANNGVEWEPDWTNRRWDKYYPWFDLSSGSGLSYYGFGYRYSSSDVGSRLCYINGVVARYAGSHFIDLYTHLFTIKPKA